MKKAMYPIFNAIVWGAVMIGCSLQLKGTGAYQEIQTILAAGAVASLFLTITIFHVKKKK